MQIIGPKYAIFDTYQKPPNLYFASVLAKKKKKKWKQET